MFNLAVRNVDAKLLYLGGTHYAIIAREFARSGALRSAVKRELAKKVGVEIKEIYLTSGEHDLLVIAEAPLGDHVTNFALATSTLGNVRTRTSRAWTEPEWTKLMSELP
jgi:uncharacterized protein with GYD domain